jgi:hypothetical protein
MAANINSTPQKAGAAAAPKSAERKGYKMTADHKPFSPVGQKLREMGFVPLPHWWVTPEELEIISRITKHHLPTVMKVKEEIRMEQDYY